MPRYFCHSMINGDESEDLEGIELPSSVQAVADADGAIRSLLSDQMMAGQDKAEICLRIVNEAGEEVARRAATLELRWAEDA